MVVQYIKRYKKYIYIAVGVVLMALLAFSGNKGYKYIKAQKQSLKNDITKLEDEKKVLQDSVYFFKNVDKELTIIEKSYYNEYKQERRRRLKAENNLKNIRYLTFNKKYLDSLAKYIKYE